MNKPIRERIWLAYKKRCTLCGRYMKLYDVTVDHIIPKSKGGKNHISNYAPAHEICNSKKGNSNKRQKRVFIEIEKPKKTLGKFSGTLEERWRHLFGTELPDKYK